MAILAIAPRRRARLRCRRRARHPRGRFGARGEAGQRCLDRGADRTRRARRAAGPGAPDAVTVLEELAAARAAALDPAYPPLDAALATARDLAAAQARRTAALAGSLR
ncbi:hypothetical protein AB5I41_13425 [Sphingomonas sp. MMS24-JH45]